MRRKTNLKTCFGFGYRNTKTKVQMHIKIKSDGDISGFRGATRGS